MSKKRWSDLFLLAAATSLILAVVLNQAGRVLSILAVPCFLIAGTLARRQMV